MSLTEAERHHLKVLGQAAQSEAEQRQKLAAKVFTSRRSRSPAAVPKGHLQKLLEHAKKTHGVEQ